MQLAPGRALCRFAALRGVAAFALVATGTAAAQTAMPDSQPFTGLRLELKRTDAQQAALNDLLQAQQTPGSPDYHKWLTPEQFAESFAPGASAESAARAWLQQQGFQVTASAANGMRLTFSGTAAQLQHAFGVGAQAQMFANTYALTSAALKTLSLPATPGFQAKALGGVLQASRPDSEAALASAVEANFAAVIVAPASTDTAAEREELLEEAAAQGITVIQAGEAQAGTGSEQAGRSGLAVISSAAGEFQISQTAEARPGWQTAPGLPAGDMRAVPDAVMTDAASLAAAITSVATQHGRVGPLAPQLYALASGHGIFTHSDNAVREGSWTTADGLGTIDVQALAKALAAGTTGVNVALTASGTTVTHGQSLSLTFAVTGTGGTPSGTVTATLKGRSAGAAVTLGPATLDANGKATVSTNTLAGDVYDLAGTYSGDATFATGVSNTVTSTVTPETVTLTATAAAAMVGGTIPVTVTATSASGVGVPSGNMTVSVYASTPPTTATGTLATTGTNSAAATVNVAATAIGMLQAQATCAGNGSFACPQPTSFTVNVTQGTPAVTLSVTPQAVVANSATQKYAVAVNVATPSGSTTTPTGTVTLLDGGTDVGTITLSKGAGSYTLSLSGTGHSIAAQYNGDTNYAAATSTTVPVDAPLISTTTALTASPTSITYGSATALTATVTPAAYAAAGAPTGTVTFRSSLGGVVGTGSLATGYVTLNTATLPVGTQTITATYAGDSNYSTSASPSVTVTVAQGKVATTTTVTVNPSTPFAAQNTTVTATVTPTLTTAAGVTLPNIVCTGRVTFFSNGVYLGAGTLAGGSASITAQLAPGTDSLTASYNGDTQCYGSTSAALVVSPAQVASTLTLQSNTTQANAGQTIQLSATVSGTNAGTLGTPSGFIAFYDLRAGVLTPIGTAPLVSTGTGSAIAILNVNGSSAGQHTFSATYAGDTIFLPANSAAVVVNFGDLSLSMNPTSLTIARGGSGTAIATVTALYGYSGPVVLSCTPPASSLITCTFSPSTLTNGGSSVLTITTTAATARASLGAGPFGAAGAVMAAALMLIPFRRSRRIAGVLVLVCCAMLVSGGCGLGVVASTNNTDGGTTGTGTGSGGTATSGTPLGTQLLTLTVSSGDGTLRRSFTYPITVQ